MKPNSIPFIKLCSTFIGCQRFLLLPKIPHRHPFLPFITATYSTICQAQAENVLEESIEKPKNSIEVLRRWGCSDTDIAEIFSRHPPLRNADLTLLQSRLSLLRGLGITSADLIKIINCRPRILSRCINRCFDERLEYFMTLFGSREMLRKAIIRNPSLLTYDFHNSVIPAIAMYEEMGISGNDLILMMLSRPTLIPRTSFNDEKMEYILKSGVTKDSKMYKHLVTIIGISRTETIRTKVANFEKFGFSDEQIWSLFGRSPLLLTLSVDKVQRNMTFIVGMMKLPANVILEYSFLVYVNLEMVLKPRVLLAGKIEEMALSPKIKGPLMLMALRMKEERFLKAFVSCHSEDVAEELMEFYRNVKGAKRLAEAYKKNKRIGFPF